jgi:translation initiation factor IF-3
LAFKPYRPKPAGARPPGARPSAGRFNRGPRPPEHNINNYIRANEVRLVGDNLNEIGETVGENIESGIYPTSRLQKWAEEVGLDLVEITPNADPPVVRIVDYNKFLYQKKKREKELKASTAKVELKEIRFGPETGEHDFEFKLRHAKNFLSDGNKVKAYVQFRGRAIVFKERGELLLLRFMKELEEYGVAEQLPKLEGKRMMVIMSPKKTSGSAKKPDGGPKKVDQGPKRVNEDAKKTDSAPQNTNDEPISNIE